MTDPVTPPLTPVRAASVRARLAAAKGLTGRLSPLSSAVIDVALDDVPALLARVEALERERDELRLTLSIAREAMRERRCYCDAWEWKYGEPWNVEDAQVDTALAPARTKGEDGA